MWATVFCTSFMLILPWLPLYLCNLITVLLVKWELEQTFLFWGATWSVTLHNWPTTADAYMIQILKHKHTHMHKSSAVISYLDQDSHKPQPHIPLWFFMWDTTSNNSQRPDVILQQWQTSGYSNLCLFQGLWHRTSQEAPPQTGTAWNNGTIACLAHNLPDQQIYACCARGNKLWSHQHRLRCTPQNSAWTPTIPLSYQWPT